MAAEISHFIFVPRIQSRNTTPDAQTRKFNPTHPFEIALEKIKYF